MASQTDILVVGAGPVGLVMASELARYGVKSRAIDAKAGRTDKSKALVMWSRSLEVMESLGCIQPILAAGAPGYGASVYAHGQRVAHLALDGLKSPYPYVQLIAQSETERVLEEHLESLGGRVERQVTLTGLTQDDSGVRATLRQADGTDEEVCCSYLVGCDGAHSTVRHLLALPFEGRTVPSEWALFDVKIDGPLPRDEFRIYWSDHGVLAFFPIPPDRFRLIADWKARPGDQGDEPTLEDAQGLLDERGPGGLRAHDPVWLSSFRINERKVAEYRKGRCFVAGDAAHIHSPVGGQGMNTGIQDAFNLAWKLALVLRGQAPVEILDSYNAERSFIAEMVLKGTSAATALVSSRNPLLETLRDRLVPLLVSLEPVQDRLRLMLGELAIHYVRSPLNAERVGLRACSWHLGHGAAPGSRAPDGRLNHPADGRAARVFELLRGTSWTLLVFSGIHPTPEAIASLDSVATAVEQRYPDLVAVRRIADGRGTHLPAWPYLDPDRSVHAEYGATEPTLYLIRPDGYVACRSQPADPGHLQAYLERWLRPRPALPVRGL